MDANDKTLHELRDDVAEIKRAVVGEPKLGHEGLVKKVARLEKDQRQLLLKAAALAGAMGGAATGLGKLIEHLAR